MNNAKFSRFNLRKLSIGAMVAGVAAAASTAHAAMDTTGITTALTDAGTAVGVVGAAVLIVYVGIKAFKMVRGAL